LKRTLLLLLLPVAALLIWVFQKKSEAPRVPFAKTVRETISNTLSTNGKVEPIEYQEIHASAPGLVQRVLVRQGDTVQKDQALVELAQPGLDQDLRAAEARVAQARAELEALRAGGRPSDRAEIEGNINRLKAQREAAQRNLASTERLVQANAATRYELDQARQSLNDLEVQIQSLSTRLTSLVGRADLQSAQARVREAEANVDSVKAHIGQNVIQAPLAGIVYDLPARAGAYLNAGSPVASVGKLDPVRVRVYVDEPEMGRVAVGQSVRITWDALPGKEWQGTVEKRPTEVIALGSRQVGEVPCTISNPNHELVPGTNVNAFILTQVVQNALTIPKTAVRRDSGIGVFVLEKDNTVKWRNIRTGVSDALHVEVTNGLHDGDAVAMPSDQVVRDGMKVTPLIQE
jgi:HlyD family secretion protein